MNNLSSLSELTVITPTLNESTNIGRLIEQLLKFYPPISIIVADDGSTDGTVEIVAEWNRKNPSIYLLNRKDKLIKGLTISVVDALKEVKTKYFFILDCDFQHPPDKIAEGFKLLIAGNKLVIGTRSSVEGWSLKRKIISWGATTLGKLSLFFRRRQRPRDIMSGYFGGETLFISNLINNHPQTISPRGYKLLFDLLKVLPGDTPIGEFSYVFNVRKFGESKIGMKQIRIFFRSLF
ncbi:glycosyltransferase [Candidatus Hodarchaeum mangrovi]